MRIFLFVPAVAVALFTFATVASADEIDPEPEITEDVVLVEPESPAPTVINEVADLRRWTASSVYRTPINQVLRAYGRCQAIDPALKELAMTQANDLSRRAAELAYSLPGQQHVRALEIQSGAETDFWRLKTAQPAERCYTPPAR